MSSTIHHPNSNGKFEFEFDRGIGKNFSTNSDYAYQFASNQFKTFKENFGIQDEICVFSADMDTWVALLAGVLEEFETLHKGNNILNMKTSSQNKK